MVVRHACRDLSHTMHCGCCAGRAQSKGGKRGGQEVECDKPGLDCSYYRSIPAVWFLQSFFLFFSLLLLSPWPWRGGPTCSAQRVVMAAVAAVVVRSSSTDDLLLRCHHHHHQRGERREGDFGSVPIGAFIGRFANRPSRVAMQCGAVQVSRR